MRRGFKLQSLVFDIIPPLKVYTHTHTHTHTHVDTLSRYGSSTNRVLKSWGDPGHHFKEFHRPLVQWLPARLTLYHEVDFAVTDGLFTRGDVTSS